MSLKTERLLARANKLVKKGELKQARDIYSNILESSPSNLEAKKRIIDLDQNKRLQPPQDQIDQIMSLYSSGQANEAQIGVTNLIRDFPNSALLRNIEGACYSEQGMIELSISSFNEAINLKFDYAEVHYNLGVALQNLLQFDDAAESYKLAIKYNHPYPAAHNNLGVIFLNKDQIDNAIKSFEWAIAYNNNYAEAYNNLGSAFQKQTLFQEAKKHFDKAVSINPKYTQAFHNLGILCEIINLPKEAITHYEKSISLDPEFAEAYRNLSKIKTFKNNDKHISQMKTLFDEKDTSLSDKARLGFALSKANEDLGNQDEQFNYLNNANKLRKQEINYSIEQSKNFHSTITKLFELPQPIIKKNKIKNSDLRPIFIVGMPRSGTTLIEQIISSHNAVHGAGELLYLRNIINPILDDHLNSNRKSFREKDMLLIRNNYLDSLANISTSKKIITDKMPVNFRLLGFILSAIPEAKIIHIKRDPIATCWSNYKHYFTAGNGFSFNQEDLAEFYNLYLELMGYWHNLFPGKIYDLSYEDLTINQKKETKRLIEHCELEWDDNCLKFHKNNRPVLTASSAQVRKKIYQGSSEAWTKHSDFLQPLINALNKN